MRLRRVLPVVGVALVLGALAPTAAAQPGDNPCTVAVSFLCPFIPTAPDLDGDVDLTTQLPSDPNALSPEFRPPVDPCDNGCI